MIKLKKKAISPVVAIALMLVTTVVAIVGFQNWYVNYSSDIFSGVETSSNQQGTISIENIIGDSLYVKSSANLTLTSIKVGNYSCEFSSNLTKGITELDIADCLDNPFLSRSQDVVVIAGSQIVRKKIYIKTLDLSDTTLSAYATLLLPLTNSLTPTKSAVYPLFSRSTTATVVDFEGVVHTVKPNEVRFLGARRVENLLEYSEDFTLETGAWSNTRCVIDATNILAPDGTNTATHYIQQSGESNAGIINYQSISYDENMIFSVYAKKAELSWITLYTKVGGQRTYFDLENGVVGTVSNIHTNPKIENVGNGWYRCSVTTTNNDVDRAGFYLAERNSDAVILPQEVGVYVWGAQLERISGSQTEVSEYVSTGVSVNTGNELVVNGGFDTDSNWTKSLGATIDNGIANLDTNIGDNPRIIQIFSKSQLGKILKIDYTVVENNLTGGAFGLYGSSGFTNSIVLGGTTYLNSSVGTHTAFIKANGPNSCNLLVFRVVGIDVGSINIDNISVKEEHYHGANLDGVKYFDTDRAGNKIADDVLQGYLNEPEGTNLILYSQDFDDTVWNGSSPTALCEQSTIPAPDGTLTAWKLISNGVNNFRAQLYVASTGNRKSIWARTVNGTGSVGLLNQYMDSSSLVNLTEEWTRFDAITDTGITGNNANFYITDFRTGNLTEILVWGAQLEQSPFATSYIKTTSSTATRSADSLMLDNTDNVILPNSFAFAGTYTPLGYGEDYEDTDVRLFGTDDSRSRDYEQRTFGVTSSSDFSPRAGGGDAFLLKQLNINQSIQTKYAFQVFQNNSNVNAKIYKDGLQKYSDTKVQILDHSNQLLEIGKWDTSVFASNIRDIQIYNKELTNSELEDITK